ncbi:hypothetical protein XENOCAPTIV_020674, partial [Xenoophorus captivus]
VMETTSVYMCFPCYQEFNTLEEVLQHQLTCTAEEDQSSSSGAAPADVPGLQTQNIKKELEDASDAEKQPTDQPRILYQCGDCDKLFKSLEEWQQHRKEGNCEQAASKSASDSHDEPETSTAENQAASVHPDDSFVPHSESSDTLKPGQEETPVDAAEMQAAETPPSKTSEGLAAEVSASDDSSPRRRGLIKKPKPEAVLLCVDCGSCFGLVSELVSHRKTKHGFEEALHRCSVCGESFLNTTLFLYHRKQHRQKGEETVLVVPEVTPEIYTLNNGSNVQDAVSSSSTETPTFTQPELFFCTHCGQSFGDGKSLAKHRMEKHSLGEPLHTCSYCGDDFMNTTQFLYHRQQHRFTSVGEVAHGVEISDGSDTVGFEDGAQSSKRLLSPSAGEPGSPLPKRGRPSFRILSANAQQAGNRASNNDSEGSAAADMTNTNQPPPAKLLQDWARTPLPHVCPYCGKTFTRRVFLRTHVYSHTGEKLFTCKTCNVDSEGSAALFACPNCPSHFSTEEQLNDHRICFLKLEHPPAFVLIMRNRCDSSVCCLVLHIMKAGLMRH